MYDEVQTSEDQDKRGQAKKNFILYLLHSVPKHNDDRNKEGEMEVKLYGSEREREV